MACYFSVPIWTFKLASKETQTSLQLDTFIRIVSGLKD